MVFVIPPVLIIAAWWIGCRPGERPWVIGLAWVTGLALVPAFVWSLSTTSVTVHGVAFALATMCLSSLARLLRTRAPGDEGGGGGEDDRDPPSGPGDSGPGVFDWDRFERDFWREVERGRRLPVA